MIKIKRPIIVGLLLVLLFFVGYLNYELTQQAIIKTSKDYQRYEELEMVKNQDYNMKLDDKDKSFEIVDSLNLDNEEITEVLNEERYSLNMELDRQVSNFDRNYFVEHRLSRDKLRGNLVDRLDEIINHDKTDSNTIKEAQEEIIKLGRISEEELQMEGIIKAKGFNEALVFISEDEIKVVVSTEDLNQQEMVKILDIVQSQTGISTDKIKIMNKQ